MNGNSMLNKYYQFSSDTFSLAGTLCHVAESNKIAILLPGSGKVDRNENHSKLKINSLNDIAQALFDAGISSFRYDKRGAGESSGDFFSTTFFDNVVDAHAAIDFIHKKFPEKHLFLIGHSEGALISTVIASSRKDLSGVVLLAGAARSGMDILSWQLEAILKSLPIWIQLLIKFLRIKPEKAQKKRFKKIIDSQQIVMKMGVKTINAGWLREFILFNPANFMPKITCPTLAITGDKDLQVPADDLNTMRDLLPYSFTSYNIKNLTHILRKDEKPASIFRYKKLIQQSTDTEMLNLITQWIHKLAPIRSCH